MHVNKKRNCLCTRSQAGSCPATPAEVWQMLGTWVQHQMDVSTTPHSNHSGRPKPARVVQMEGEQVKRQLFISTIIRKEKGKQCEKMLSDWLGD